MPSASWSESTEPQTPENRHETSRQQLADNEAKIRTAMTRLLNGDIPSGGKCDIKTLAATAGVDRTAFYGTRPYSHLRTEFEQQLEQLRNVGERPDPRDAQVARLKDEIGRLKDRLAQSDATISDLADFRDQALAGSPPSITRSPGSARKVHGRRHPPGCWPLPTRSSTCHDHRPPQRTRPGRRCPRRRSRPHSLEAACDLVIGTGWLHRDDFSSFVSTATSITGGVTELAHIDWHAVIASRDAGHLPCGSAENRILKNGSQHRRRIPVDLNDALCGLDPASIALVVRAARHANGQRPADQPRF